MATSNIVTGQYVRISQTPASIGERMLAQLIDWTLQSVYSLGLSYLIFNYELLSFSEELQLLVMF